MGQEEQRFLKAKLRVETWVNAVRRLVRIATSSELQTTREEVLSSGAALKKEASTLIVNLTRTKLFSDLRRLVKDTRRRLASSSDTLNGLTESDSRPERRNQSFHQSLPFQPESFRRFSHDLQNGRDSTKIDNTGMGIPTYPFPIFHNPSLPGFDFTALNSAGFFSGGAPVHPNIYPPMFLMNVPPTGNSEVTSTEGCHNGEETRQPSGAFLDSQEQ